MISLLQIEHYALSQIYVDETAIQASRRKDPDGTTKLPPNIFPLPRAPVFNDNNVIYLGTVGQIVHYFPLLICMLYSVKKKKKLKK